MAPLLRLVPTAEAAPPLIRFEGISKTYRTLAGDRIAALERIDLGIAKGEFLSLLGPSGCGKSTLMKILAGIVTPSSGQIALAGKRLAGPQGNIGVVFQEATLLPWLDVLRNVLVPADVARIPRAELKQRALELLELVGLGGFAGKYPGELSGGMQQRVAICRALLRDPEIMLMDEPFGALDALTRDHMNLELQRIWQLQHNTVLFVTHSIQEAVLLSDRIVVMSARPGRILDQVNVDLPRPRALDLVNSPVFGRYAARIRELLNSGGEALGSGRP